MTTVEEGAVGGGRVTGRASEYAHTDVLAENTERVKSMRAALESRPHDEIADLNREKLIFDLPSTVL